MQTDDVTTHRESVQGQALSLSLHGKFKLDLITSSFVIYKLEVVL